MFWPSIHSTKLFYGVKIRTTLTFFSLCVSFRFSFSLSLCLCFASLFYFFISLPFFLFVLLSSSISSLFVWAHCIFGIFILSISFYWTFGLSAFCIFHMHAHFIWFRPNKQMCIGYESRPEYMYSILVLLPFLRGFHLATTTTITKKMFLFSSLIL